ncbi:MAG: DNA repair protein RadC [Actinomycetia bacterium]|nr:DNA repair protein RadC [Actinomycetes bacterium]
MEGRGFTVKELPYGLRPRERLLRYGAGVLSDADLLAVLINTGKKGESVIVLSVRIIKIFEGLEKLSQATCEELKKIKGLGEAKTANLLASFELGKRIACRKFEKRTVIKKPNDVADILMPEMRYLEKEYFKAIILNTKNEVLKIEDISIGSLSSSIVHPRELFKAVMKHNGASVVVVHNHPSGDPSPSPDDVGLTKRLIKAGDILGISLLDHIVFGNGRFVSLKELNLI